MPILTSWALKKTQLWNILPVSTEVMEVMVPLCVLTGSSVGTRVVCGRVTGGTVTTGEVTGATVVVGWGLVSGGKVATGGANVSSNAGVVGVGLVKGIMGTVVGLTVNSGMTRGCLLQATGGTTPLKGAAGLG